MFVSGSISAEFALELVKVVGLHPPKIARLVLLNELGRIEDGSYNGFGTNKTTVEIVDSDWMLTELLIAKRSDEENKTVVQSVAYETCMFPVFGKMNVFEYLLDLSGSITGECVKIADDHDDMFVLAKTTESRKLYKFVPESETCILLSCTSKKTPDDYYVTYDQRTLQRIEVVSTSSRESRVQFWLTFHKALRESLSLDLLTTLHDEAETIKLRHFLGEIIERERAYA